MSVFFLLLPSFFCPILADAHNRRVAFLAITSGFVVSPCMALLLAPLGPPTTRMPHAPRRRGAARPQGGPRSSGAGPTASPPPTAPAAGPRPCPPPATTASAGPQTATVGGARPPRWAAQPTPSDLPRPCVCVRVCPSASSYAFAMPSTPSWRPRFLFDQSLARTHRQICLIKEVAFCGPWHLCAAVHLST